MDGKKLYAWLLLCIVALLHESAMAATNEVDTNVDDVQIKITVNGSTPPDALELWEMEGEEFPISVAATCKGETVTPTITGGPISKAKVYTITATYKTNGNTYKAVLRVTVKANPWNLISINSPAAIATLAPTTLPAQGSVKSFTVPGLIPWVFSDKVYEVDITESSFDPNLSVLMQSHVVEAGDPIPLTIVTKSQLSGSVAIKLTNVFTGTVSYTKETTETYSPAGVPGTDTTKQYRVDIPQGRWKCDLVGRYYLVTMVADPNGGPAQKNRAYEGTNECRAADLVKSYGKKTYWRHKNLPPT